MSTLELLEKPSDSNKLHETENFGVVDLVSMMVDQTKKSTDIADVNTEVGLLSLNASIEAARSGEQGRSFSIIADNMRNLSDKTGIITKELEKKLHEFESTLIELEKTTQDQKNETLGIRLSDLSLTNIDLIDRNLFERTADVRWWAAGGRLVRALTEKSTESISDASQSLSKILSAYTAYDDLILCDIDGNIVANGASEHASTNKNVSNTEWFQTGLIPGNNGYGFQSVHKESLVNNKTVLTYSAPIFDSRNNDKICGVLGVMFDWTDLAQTIINETPLSQEDMQNSRICIVDDNGLILADTDVSQINNILTFTEMDKLFSEKKGHVLVENDDIVLCYAHSKSPGYQECKTWWHSVIIQKILN